jgi:hypothetical protein
MTQTVNHPGNLSLSQLQKSMWRAELNFYKLLKISVSGNKTVTEHTNDNGTIVPNRSLVLIEDNDAGTAAAPAGTEEQPVCRGKAMIGGTEKKVAAFRKKPA